MYNLWWAGILKTKLSIRCHAFDNTQVSGFILKRSAMNMQVSFPFNRIVILVIICLPYSSCAVSDTVVAHYNSDQPARAKHLTHIGNTHWSYFWGLLKQSDWPAGCQQGSNMSKVTVKTNPGFVIIAVVTLGIVVPQKLEWDCGPPSRATGEIGN